MSIHVSEQGTAYQLLGDSQAPVVVLIHGIGLSQHIWADFMQPLATDYCVLAYDLMGHGGSQPPASPPDLQAYARQLMQLLDALSIQQAHLIGFSLGGMINRRCAMDYSDRVQSLVILNSPHERDPQVQAQIEARASKIAVHSVEAVLPETLQRWFTPAYREQNPAQVAAIGEAVLQNHPQVYGECYRVLATGVKELIRPQPPIAQPTLVITGAKDTGSSPEMTHAIAAEMANAQALIVPELQHMGLVEQPAVFISPIVDFLQQVSDYSPQI